MVCVTTGFWRAATAAAPGVVARNRRVMIAICCSGMVVATCAAMSYNAWGTVGESPNKTGLRQNHHELIPTRAVQQGLINILGIPSKPDNKPVLRQPSERKRGPGLL